MCCCLQQLRISLFVLFITSSHGSTIRALFLLAPPLVASPTVVEDRHQSSGGCDGGAIHKTSRSSVGGAQGHPGEGRSPVRRSQSRLTSPPHQRGTFQSARRRRSRSGHADKAPALAPSPSRERSESVPPLIRLPLRLKFSPTRSNGRFHAGAAALKYRRLCLPPRS